MSDFVRASELIKNSMPSRLFFDKPQEFPELTTVLNRTGLKDPSVIPRIKIQALPNLEMGKQISQLVLEFFNDREPSQSKVQGYAKITDKEAINLAANLIAFVRVNYKIPFADILSQVLNTVSWKTSDSRFLSTDANADMKYTNSWNCIEALAFRKVVDK